MPRSGEAYRASQRVRNKRFYDLHNVKVICECGANIKKFTMKSHIKTKKHFKMLDKKDMVFKN